MRPTPLWRNGNNSEMQRRTRNPRFVKHYWDGKKWVNQFRKNGRLIRLPDGHFDDAFWQVYWAVEANLALGEVRPIGEKRTRVGSVDAGLIGYYRSTTFRNLALSSQRTLRQKLEADFRPILGNVPLGHLRTRHIADLIAAKAETSPTGARLLLAAVRSFAKHCVAMELIDRDPSLGIKGPAVDSDGFATWSDQQIRQFEDRHPVGSLARLAMGLHLYTAQRTSDVLAMGWQHVRGGVIRVTQKKTGQPVAIPIHPELQRILDAVPRGTGDLGLVFGASGRRFDQSTYNWKWRRWVAEAELPKALVPHGLRKSAARRLAEAGCSTHQIAGVTGHKTLSEIERYTEKVDREWLAQQAMAAITTKTRTKTV
jgi:integrase